VHVSLLSTKSFQVHSALTVAAMLELYQHDGSSHRFTDVALFLSHILSCRVFLSSLQMPMATISSRSSATSKSLTRILKQCGKSCFAALLLK
jgi:hypothetical protein